MDCGLWTGLKFGLHFGLNHLDCSLTKVAIDEGNWVKAGLWPWIIPKDHVHPWPGYACMGSIVLR